jgi:hypothetical protein
MLKYPFESLGPERFQEFCQSLLLKEYPNLQCFPVGMPDGGRDGILRIDRSSGFLVFQVKFIREPKENINTLEWIQSVVELELPKIKRLISKGAKNYVLITNAPGTSHLDAGTIDKIQTFLEKEISIPVSCLWREDLNRRLDNAWDLKWIYPELMTGNDLIRSVIESGLTEDKERRASTIRAFIRDQYTSELEVKFKQVELQNKLFDLFIDVPLMPQQKEGLRKKWTSVLDSYWKILHSSDHSIGLIEKEDSLFELDVGRDTNNQVGAAEFLLHPVTQNKLNQIVLEGAPGQGKSTITQYVCQIHRTKILNSTNATNIPEKFHSVPVRLPIRVDLRDYADWISKKNPFSATEETSFSQKWHKSLESFLAALIENQSGNQAFSTTDLTSVSKVSSLLLVFDGLDEVADIALRMELVYEMNKGINRLNENAVSIQVIVTTRPAAIADNPNIKFEGFIHTQLQFLNRLKIEEYADKWFSAKKINPKDKSEIKTTLKEKLDQPHLRDLARNTMQLAILLSLIHLRGSSLPDKRTALYDHYVDLFFSRESEKSTTVRDHRDLLIQIHQYLAWVLHTESEKGNNLGSISAIRLKEVVCDYLKLQGHGTDLVDGLFNGIVERVVALVSRVEGTYEFEVQPLREYFAARYLFETAPYSPPGKEQKGTKPDRFDGISRNPYWLNVTRFFAGCISKGELLFLIDRLEDLCNTPGYKQIKYSRELAVTLLSDWVFFQHPKSVSDVVNLILDEIGLKIFLSKTSTQRHLEFTLPKKCGQEEVLNYCFNLLRIKKPTDFEKGLVDLIKANSDLAEREVYWTQLFNDVDKKEKNRLLSLGVQLEIVPNLPEQSLLDLISENPLCSNRIELFMNANKNLILEKDDEKFEVALNLILDGRYRRANNENESILAAVNTVINRDYIGAATRGSTNIHIGAIFEKMGRKISFTGKKFALDEKFQGCLDFINLNTQLEKVVCEDWATTLIPWNSLVEQGRKTWGERFCFFELANQSAGIKSIDETHTESPDLFDSSKPLCNRARYARLRAGQISYWKKHLELAYKDSTKTAFTLLILMAWASSTVLENLVLEVEKAVEAVDEQDWSVLIKALKRFKLRSSHYSQSISKGLVDINNFPETLSTRCIAIFGNRVLNIRLYEKYLKDYEGDSSDILEICQTSAFSILRKDSDVDKFLAIIKMTYKKGILTERFQYQTVKSSFLNSLTEEKANKILVEANEYPGFIVATASNIIQARTFKKVKPVIDIATEEHWFSTTI